MKLNLSNLAFATLEIQNFASVNNRKASKKREARNAHEYIRKVRIVPLERECTNNEKAEHLMHTYLLFGKNH